MPIRPIVDPFISAGLYLGEVTRLILLSLAKDPSLMLFGGEGSTPIIPEAISIQGSFPTSMLNSIVEDSSLSKSRVEQEFRKAFKIPAVSYKARYVVSTWSILRSILELSY